MFAPRCANTLSRWNYTMIRKIESLPELHARCRAGLNGCLLYRETTHPYGMLVTVHGKMTAHRAAWTFANGVVPAGLEVLHRCDQPRCCNPDHLFLGTQLDNMRDMVSKGRKNSRNRKRLTDAQVAQMREMRARGQTIAAIAQSFLVPWVSAEAIINRRRRAEVKP